MKQNDTDSTGDEKRSVSVMRVTLLSGFLGAGKTTLLKRILRLNNERSDADKLKMAVIVNDMGEINLDADEIRASKVIQEGAEMVEMHNGCICCTLRGDLLKTVKTLSEEGKFDYLVIESTGIGEPLPVAQTFAMDVDSIETGVENDGKGDSHPADEIIPDGTLHVDKKKLTIATDEKKSLFHYAKLDTLVTVVDALNIYEVLGSIETLADENNISGMIGNSPGEMSDEQRKNALEMATALDTAHLRKLLKSRKLDTKGKKKDLAHRLVYSFEEDTKKENADDRPISRLWLDQIEFANVIVVSKAAKLLEKQDGDKKLNDIEVLLKKLNPKANITTPQKDMYGDLDVSKTLINTGLFDMAESQASSGWAEELLKEEHNPETEEYGISSFAFVAKDMPFHPERLAMILRGFGDYGSAIKSKSGEEDDDVEETLTASYHHEDVFKGVIRTKGHIWLANANAYPVHFQSAGAHIDMIPSDQPFLVEIKNKMDSNGFPDDAPAEEKDALTSYVETKYKTLKGDGLWTEKFGDRRSQLVFIGLGLDKAKMKTWLTQALITEEETAAMGGMNAWKNLNDPFYGGKMAAAHFSIDP